jgi:hypothetical protein
MAVFKIETTKEEQKQLLQAIYENQHVVISVARLSTYAKMNKNRARYIVTDLEDSGYIVRVPVKVFESKYVRYLYEVTEAGTLFLNRSTEEAE